MQHLFTLDCRAADKAGCFCDAAAGVGLRSSLGLRRMLWISLASLTLLQSTAWAQRPINTNGTGSSPRASDGFHDPDLPEVSPRVQEQMADRRNSERQRELVADTEKLFQLASQLRDEVAKSNKDQLSVPVVKRSEEIEKLARSVKDKMRGY